MDSEGTETNLEKAKRRLAEGVKMTTKNEWPLKLDASMLGGSTYEPVTSKLSVPSVWATTEYDVDEAESAAAPDMASGPSLSRSYEERLMQEESARREKMYQEQIREKDRKMNEILANQASKNYAASSYNPNMGSYPVGPAGSYAGTSSTHGQNGVKAHVPEFKIIVNPHDQWHQQVLGGQIRVDNRSDENMEVTISVRYT